MTKTGAIDAATLKMLPEEMQSWPGINPPPEYLEKCEFISSQAFTGKGMELRIKIWENIKK